ncbi:MAG: DUF86 domain-containing protein [Defluviicoccus sp.]|nr:DUF86 domain-containing protein [Defluviicoccus sp.]
MRRDDASFLLDMLVAARDAVAFAAGLSFSEFARDQRTQLAILKSVEIVGEAASRVSADTVQGNPSIPWREIVGMRNRLVHAYFEIDLRLVWDTVVDDLPALISQLEPLVPPDDR